MAEDKFVKQYKGKDGRIVANIEKTEDGDFQVWNDITNSLIAEYQDLSEAHAEARMIVIRYNQDQENR